MFLKEDIFQINNKKSYLTKSDGLKYLTFFNLPIPEYGNDIRLIPKYKNYSIRTSLVEANKTKNFFYKKGYCMPSAFNVSLGDLEKQVATIKKLFKKKFNCLPDILIHETHSIKFSGNVYIDKDKVKIIVEYWDSYNKEGTPLFSKSFFRIKQIKIDKLFLPINIYKLPINKYILEWIITDNNRLLFMELNIL